MNWIVIEKCYAGEFEPPFDKEIAQFNSKIFAEDFIDLVIPKDDKKRFRIEYIN